MPQPSGAHWREALGAKVRALREQRGFTRAELAEKSSLSIRFLADVEAGRANPSLGSLHDLAGALDVDVVALVEKSSRARPVALLGLRGAGKSTVGKRVAKELGWHFVEVDKEIEREAGMSLSALFALHGEAHYRTLEERVLRALLSSTDPKVIATGGGIVTHDDTFALLKSRALTVWLKATPQEHWDRVVAQGDVRPMQQRSRARAELQTLFETRAPLYAEAELVVDTTALDVDHSAKKVAAAAKS